MPDALGQLLLVVGLGLYFYAQIRQAREEER